MAQILDYERWRKEERLRVAACRLRIAEWNQMFFSHLREGALSIAELGADQALEAFFKQVPPPILERLALSLQPMLTIQSEYWDLMDHPENLPLADARHEPLQGSVYELARTICYVQALDTDVATLITRLPKARMDAFQLLPASTMMAWAEKVPLRLQRAEQIGWWCHIVETLNLAPQDGLGPALWLSTLEG